jgi:hypothetical protein
MKNLALSFFLFLIAIKCYSQTYSSLVIFVSDSETSLPLDSVLILIKEAGWSSNTTGADGKAFFEKSLPIGEIHYVASRLGYQGIEGAFNITTEEKSNTLHVKITKKATSVNPKSISGDKNAKIEFLKTNINLLSQIMTDLNKINLEIFSSPNDTEKYRDEIVEKVSYAYPIYKDRVNNYGILLKPKLLTEIKNERDGIDNLINKLRDLINSGIETRDERVTELVLEILLKQSEWMGKVKIAFETEREVQNNQLKQLLNE